MGSVRVRQLRAGRGLGHLEQVVVAVFLFDRGVLVALRLSLRTVGAIRRYELGLAAGAEAHYPIARGLARLAHAFNSTQWQGRHVNTFALLTNFGSSYLRLVN